MSGDRPPPSKMDDFLRTVGVIALVLGGLYGLSQCAGSSGATCHVDQFTGFEVGDC